MFNFQNIQNMSNSEIREYQDKLKNYYEILKIDINEKLTEMDKMDSEWAKTMTELNKRKQI